VEQPLSASDRGDRVTGSPGGDAQRRAAFAAWLGLPPERVAGVDADVIDAIVSRIEAEVSHVVTLQRELLDRFATTVHELRDRSLRDPLTGLANRRAVESELRAAVARAQREARSLLVVLVDVDRLKVANDLHGHWAGDALILEAARRLVSIVRRGDLVGRWGGDEFVVICPDVEPDSVEAIAERLRAAIGDRPLPLGEATMPFGLSLGCALLRAESTPESLLALADAAMYRDKARRQEQGSDASLGGEVPRTRARSFPP
jgi:diguanylate cyclase (GGDEF)-like protein